MLKVKIEKLQKKNWFGFGNKILSEKTHLYISEYGDTGSDLALADTYWFRCDLSHTEESRVEITVNNLVYTPEEFQEEFDGSVLGIDPYHTEGGCCSWFGYKLSRYKNQFDNYDGYVELHLTNRRIKNGKPIVIIFSHENAKLEDLRDVRIRAGNNIKLMDV